MKATMTEGIFDFFAEDKPAPGSAAARVLAAVLGPNSDPELDEALVRFQNVHAKFDVALKLLDERAKVRTLYKRLVAHCREHPAYTSDQASTTETTHSLVSTKINDYLSETAAGRGRDVDDSTKLWPVLLEITARQKLKRPLDATTPASPDFTPALEAVLREAFEKWVKGNRFRTIFAHYLLGREPREFKKLTGDTREDVVSAVLFIHTRLHAHL